MSVSDILQSYANLANCVSNSNPHVAAELLSQHLRDSSLPLVGLQTVLSAWFTFKPDENELLARPRLTYGALSSLKGEISTAGGLTLAFSQGFIMRPGTNMVWRVKLLLFPGNSGRGVCFDFYVVDGRWRVFNSPDNNATLRLDNVTYATRSDFEDDPWTVASITEEIALPDTRWTLEDFGITGTAARMAQEFDRRFQNMSVCQILLKLVTETLNITDAQDVLAQLASQPGKLDISEYVAAYKQKVGSMMHEASDYLNSAIDMLCSGSSPFAILQSIVTSVARTQQNVEDASSEEQLEGMIPWSTATHTVDSTLVIFTPQFWGRVTSFIGSALTVAGSFLVKALGVLVAATGGVISSLADLSAQATESVAYWDSDSKDDRYCDATLVNAIVSEDEISGIKVGNATLHDYLQAHGSVRLYTPYGNYYFNVADGVTYLTHFFGLALSGATRGGVEQTSAAIDLHSQYQLYSPGSATASEWQVDVIVTHGTQVKLVAGNNGTQLQWPISISAAEAGMKIPSILSANYDACAMEQAADELTQLGRMGPVTAQAWAGSLATTNRVTAGMVMQAAAVLLVNMKVRDDGFLMLDCPLSEQIFTPSWGEYPENYISAAGLIRTGGDGDHYGFRDHYSVLNRYMIYYMNILAIGLMGTCVSWNDFTTYVLPMMRRGGARTDASEDDQALAAKHMLLRALSTLTVPDDADYGQYQVVFAPGITQSSLSTYRCAPPSRTFGSVIWSVVLGVAVIAAIAITAVTLRNVVRKASRAFYEALKSDVKWKYDLAATSQDFRKVYAAERRLNLLGSILGQGHYDVTNDWVDRPEAGETVVMSSLAQQAADQMDLSAISETANLTEGYARSVYNVMPDGVVCSEASVQDVYAAIVGATNSSAQ